MARSHDTNPKLIAYLNGAKECNNTWVDHELLTEGFSLRDIIQAVTDGFLVLIEVGVELTYPGDFDSPYFVGPDQVAYRISI